MYSHPPGCLEGPVSGSRDWWLEHVDARQVAPKFRAALVARIRREIAAGTYDTPEKLQAALEELLRRSV